MKKIIIGLSLALFLAGCTSNNQQKQENARTERSSGTIIEGTMVTGEASNVSISDTGMTHSQTSGR